LFYAPNVAKHMEELINRPMQYGIKKAVALIGGAGVTYESGNGDYAEWLERKDVDEVLESADVVGVYAGKISHQTKGADHVMVVSVKPIVLGNMPPKGEEQAYEKVPVMGQGPVHVLGGVQEGDFLIASGWEDGTAVGVNPAHIRPDQLDKVIGVAWGSNFLPEGLVNTAVGLQTNDIARIMQTQFAQLDETTTQLASLQTENDDLKSALAQLNAQMQSVTTTLANKERQAAETMRLLEALASQLNDQEASIYTATAE